MRHRKAPERQIQEVATLGRESLERLQLKYHEETLNVLVVDGEMLINVWSNSLSSLHFLAL